MTACPVCGDVQWMALPNPAARSLRSDGRIIHAPLQKRGCRECGYVGRDAPPPDVSGDASYSLYAHEPGLDEEGIRQAHYASWIASALAPCTPRRIVDVGCGNGSLLLALGRVWPCAELRGIDASPAGIAFAAAAGLNVQRAAVGDLDAGTIDADLAIAVNVIEHAIDPQRFLRHLAGCVAPGGSLVVICPDATAPGFELLFADHVHSFIPEHLAAVARSAGLSPCVSARAPAVLGDFQLLIARAIPTGVRTVAASATNGAGSGLDAKASYLRRWAELDERLLARMPAGSDLVCFGVGETARILRAYAPAVWSRVRACTADRPRASHFHDRPVVDPASLTSRDAILVAVHPKDHAFFVRRFVEDRRAVISWHDLIEGPSDR